MASQFAGYTPYDDNNATEDMPQEGRLRYASTDLSEDELLAQWSMHHDPEHQAPGNDFLIKPQNALDEFDEQAWMTRTSFSTSVSTAQGISYPYDDPSAELGMGRQSHSSLPTRAQGSRSLPAPYIREASSSARGDDQPPKSDSLGDFDVAPENDNFGGFMNMDPSLFAPNTLAAFEQPVDSFSPRLHGRNTNDFVPSFSGTPTSNTTMDDGPDHEDAEDSDGSSEVQVVANTSAPPKKTRKLPQPDWVRNIIDMYYPQKYQDSNFQVDFYPPVTPLSTLTGIVKGRWLSYIDDHPLPKSEADVPAYVDQLRLYKPEIDHIFHLMTGVETNERISKEESAQEAFKARAKRDGPKYAVQHGGGLRSRKTRAAKGKGPVVKGKVRVAKRK